MTVAAVVILLAAVDLNGWGQVLFNAIFGVLVMAIAGVVSWLFTKFNTLNADRDAKAEKIVEQKFNAMAAEFRASMDILTERLRQFGADVEKGERVVEHLREETRRLELASVQAQADFRGWLMEKFATKKELGELRQQLAGGRIG